MQFLWIEKFAPFLVLYKRVIVPAAPEPDHHFSEFTRTMIAVALGNMGLPIEILCFRPIGRRHQVPCRPTPTHHIKRHEVACQIKWLSIGRGHGTGETNMFSHHR